MLKLQFLTCKEYSEQRSTVNNCNFSKLQFFQCTSTVILLHIFAVQTVQLSGLSFNGKRYLDICKYENVLPFDLKNSQTFGYGKFNQNYFMNMQLMDQQVCKLQIQKLVSVEFATSNFRSFSYYQMHIFCHFDFCLNRKKILMRASTKFRD